MNTENGCVNCGAPVNWEFARPEHTCLKCGKPVGIKDEDDEFDATMRRVERVDAVVKMNNRAAQIVAEEIHQIVSRSVTVGTEAALEKMREMPELQGFDTAKIINIMRREVCWKLADLANHAADGWDKLIFKRPIRFEPPNPEDPHGGDDPHGHQ